MSTTDIQVQNLIVNKLSYDQWKAAKDAGDLSPTETYDLTDKDTAFVHTSGNETIAGTKTFTSGIRQKATQAQPIYQSTAYTKGTAPTSDTYLAHTTYRDNNDTTLMDEYYYIPNNTNAMSYILRLRDCSSSSATAYNDVIKTRWDGTNGYYKIAENHETGFTTSCPPPTEDTTTSKQIDTVGARNTKLQNYALDSNAVHKTGNENIAGQKTFTDKLTVDDNIFLIYNQNTYRHIYTDNSAITKGTVPSSTTGTDLALRDSNNAYIGSVAVWYSTGRACVSGLYAYNPQAGTTNSVSLELHYDYSGATYATAPTPPASDDSNKIATTEWVNDNAITLSDLSTVHVVVETYVNGTSWYRIYDDGWVEQGGIASSVPANSSSIVTFLKSFTNTNYSCQLTFKTTSVIGGGAGDLSYNPSASLMTIFNGQDSAYNVCWYACGMGA